MANYDLIGGDLGQELDPGGVQMAVEPGTVEFLPRQGAEHSGMHGKHVSREKSSAVLVSFQEGDYVENKSGVASESLDALQSKRKAQRRRLRPRSDNQEDGE
jgi:hypothetical protein